MSGAVIAAALCAAAAPPQPTNDVIRTAAELSAAFAKRGTADLRFELCATIISSVSPSQAGRFSRFFVMDESGGASLWDARDAPQPGFTTGDVAVVKGELRAINAHDKANSLVMADCTSIETLSHGSMPDPVRISADDLDRSDILNTPVILEGILLEARQDEIDPYFFMLVIDCSKCMVYASVVSPSMNRPVDELRKSVGATVELTGIPYLHIGLRRHNRRWFHLDGDDAVRILKPPSGDLFRAPKIDRSDTLSPEAVAALGRRRATGHVLAVWNDDTLLMQTDAGEPMKVSVVTSLPAVGDSIEAVGYAETDLFHVNLASAIWRPADLPHLPPEAPEHISVTELFEDGSGGRKIAVGYHGRTVHIEGIAQGIASNGRSGGRLLVASKGYTVAVDFSKGADAADRIASGSLVSVTGVCIVETETWNRHSTLPKTHGLFIAMRSPDDIAVISAPPWWTPGRFTAVAASLLVLLMAVLVWNNSLRLMAEKRGKALASEEMDRLEADLKASERTRLSAELHDSIAQNLSGVSMEMDAALNGDETLPPVAEQHLIRASRTLDSCRVELRNCIWDLRSHALDEPDMNSAIHIALGPTIGKTRLSVRFDVPRSQLSENTARIILNIVRELASNAVRHGHATEIDVSGRLEGDDLHFSVSDSGRGFDPARHPGIAEGHFGLKGIEERVSLLDGEMSIVSAPGKGTTASITLKLPSST